MGEVKESKDNYLFRFLWTSIGIILFCLLYGLLGYYIDPQENFGDHFGALTALFSGLAFAGIIFAILQQRRELELQREELQLTREEFKTQNQTLRKQRFDNTFFNLLSQHSHVIDGLFFQEGGAASNKGTGYDAFQAAHGLLVGKAGNDFVIFKRDKGIPGNNGLNELSKELREEFVASTIWKWYTHNSHNIHLYFRSIKGILRTIHRSALLDTLEEREIYGSLLRDQISYYEQPVILYMSLIPEPSLKGVSFYIKVYDLLKGVDEKTLITFLDKQMFDEWADKTEPVNNS